MAKWGSVSEYVEENFDAITTSLATGKSKSEVLSSHVELSGFKMEALRKAYTHLKKKKAASMDDDAKFHGNSALMITEEAMTMGYLLMRSENGCAACIEGIRSFSATLRKNPLSYDAAQRLYMKYQFLF